MATQVMTPEFSHESAPTHALSYLVPLGRALFALIFILASIGHFSRDTIRYAASQGVPLANLLVPVSGLMALAGGISVLLGFKTRYGALLLAAFLIPVTLMMHRFWDIADPATAMMQRVMFLKNTAMLGTTLLLGYFGGGPYSLDARAPEAHADPYVRGA